MAKPPKETLLNCPKCPGKLEDHDIEDLDVYCCFVCHGLWFDAGELEAVIKRDSRDFDYIEVGQEDYQAIGHIGVDLDHKLGKCPRCKAVMKKSPYENNHKVLVDLCPKGHGIWLDGGEIESLRHRGLVALSEHAAYYMEMFRYLFSTKGFMETMRKGTRVLEDRAEGQDPSQDPRLTS